MPDRIVGPFPFLFFAKGCGLVYEHRWGVVVDVLKKLLPLEKPLRAGWDLRRFNSGDDTEVGPESGGNGLGEQEDMSALNTVIKSAFFWVYGNMCAALGSCIDEAQGWLAGCPCHERILQHAGSLHEGMRLIRKEFAAVPERFDGAAPWCPMSGRRAPEMAAGAFRKFVMDAIDLRSADVLADARVHLNENQSAVVVQDMELGTAHLAATMQLKLAHWEKPPWKLCGLAHHDPITASRVARELIDMNVGSLPRVGQHALTLDFLFADGKHQSIVERLAQQQPVSTDERQVLATFKFIDVNEQSIERDHADLKLAVGTRTVSLAYGSLKLRFNEVERILGDAKLKEQLTQCFFELRSPKNLAKEFRLNGHPQVQEALMNRCLSHQLRRILADVVYRGDIEAQYASMRDANRANKENTGATWPTLRHRLQTEGL